MTKTATFHGWQPTKFGTAEQFPSSYAWEGRFYSHSFDGQGHADVVAAATDFIERTVEDEMTKRIAFKLMEQEGVDTDLYQRETNTRWLLDAGDLIKRAAEIRGVL